MYSQVHKYCNIDTVPVFLAPYTTTMDLKLNNQDMLWLQTFSFNSSIFTSKSVGHVSKASLNMLQNNRAFVTFWDNRKFPPTGRSRIAQRTTRTGQKVKIICMCWRNLLIFLPSEKDCAQTAPALSFICTVCIRSALICICLAVEAFRGSGLQLLLHE